MCCVKLIMLATKGKSNIYFVIGQYISRALRQAEVLGALGAKSLSISFQDYYYFYPDKKLKGLT